MIFSQVVNMVNLGIAVLDKDLRVCHWNRWLEMHTGIPEKTIQNTPLLDHFPNLNQKWFLRGCKTVFTLGNVAFFSHKLHRHVLPITAAHHLSPEFKFMRQNCTIGPVYSDDHKVDYICMMIQDATEVASLETRLLAISTRDPLTGLYNRNYFETKLKEDLERHRRYGGALSVIVIDIDGLKPINESLGNHAGDTALVEIAGLLTGRLRTVDTIARYGADEFCVILPETPLSAAMLVAGQLREKVAQAALCPDKTGRPVTISMGVMESAEKGVNCEDLLKKINDALTTITGSPPNSLISLSD
ncbi:sensor domain-containing diguanylate cyclase [Desulfosudis oleivorans]|uniref:diguanylate cyclase n=1 Tax=Desulfosudis oleivorans (strain DSM 6200 / JCM 39069 / Hxd3) TaxID=96561 RepID=A9A0T1_DESOH|nr:diguanylate cyclase [Desulfosudis oleivorans]ABW67556.1 diguanylate cyclase [Desulfosudis oleivorans Hxd3]